jgi:2-polyprenyl-3-methyl-5-hydroxy-6-metoxy-1,4-benzoquinol methylase
MDKHLPEAQKEIYRRMWVEVPGYRSRSPGELLVPTFLERAWWIPGETLLDAGCGPGRAGMLLKNAGLEVVWLDITERSLDPEVRGAGVFIEACLWNVEMPAGMDWIYCCDVLEHIPPEHVDAVLDFIAATARKGAFLQIALWQEAWGNKIGETLHLTVESAQWWLEKIEKRMTVKWKGDSGDGRLIVLLGARVD